MPGIAVTHIDDADYPLMTGTHKGATGASVLYDPGADFASCGVNAEVGQLVQNDTDSSEGACTASTEDTVTCTLAGGTNNSWTNGDTYIILKGATEDAVLSTQYTDKRYGRKVVNPSELDEDGYLVGDRDADEDDEDTFGPNQPERVR